MTDKKKVRIVDLTKCFNCYNCEKVCSKRHGHQRNVRDGVRKGCFVLPLACRQCEDPECVKACKFGAHIQEDGISYIDKEKCVGCGVCAKKCPYNSIIVIKKRGKDKNIIYKCDRCRGFKNRACFPNCPSGALQESEVY